MLRVKYSGDSLLFNDELEEELEEFLSFKPFYKDFSDAGFVWGGHIAKGTKQGFVGVATRRSGTSETRRGATESLRDEGGGDVIAITPELLNKKKYIVKLSQYLNFGMEHEYLVMKGLNLIREFCPHFVKVYGKTVIPVHEQWRNLSNPFPVDKSATSGGAQATSGGAQARRFNTTVIFMEAVEGRKFYRYIKNDGFTFDHILSVVKQTLLATAVAYEKIKFTHYDLHTNNIMVKKVPINSVFLYRLDEHRSYLVPTYGYSPVILDFGFSYDIYCDHHPMYGPLAHTKVGFVPSRHNKFTDAKLFLTSISHEVKRYKADPQATTFRNLVKNIYKDIHVDLRCGWDTGEGLSLSDKFLKKVRKVFRRSPFFDRHSGHIIDVLQGLIELPLTRSQGNSSEQVEDLLRLLIDMFQKIEHDIPTDMCRMYILKTMVESAYKNRQGYSHKGTRSSAVDAFRSDVMVAIDSVENFCNPQVNWEKLLCTLLCCATSIGDYLFDLMKDYIKRRKDDYDNLKLRGTHEIYEYLDANLPSPFVFDAETVVYVWDALDEINYSIQLPLGIIEQVNMVEPYDRGQFLYEFIAENK